MRDLLARVCCWWWCATTVLSVGGRLASVAAATSDDAARYATLSRGEVHAVLSQLYRDGRYIELERVAQQLLQHNPTATKHSAFTSVYEYMGVAQYAQGELDRAIASFERGVEVDDDDVMSWVHLGNSYLYKLQLAKSIRALEVAVFEKGATPYLHLLVKARNWIASWRDRDELLARVEAKFRDDQRYGRNPGATALDFVDVDPAVLKHIATSSYRSGPPPRRRLCCDDDTDDARSRHRGSNTRRELTLRAPRLRVGFVSSDFGVHPVATLMRGLLAMLARDDDDAKQQQRVTVYCFSLTAATSWWKRNITRSVDHMVSLRGKDPAEAAAIVHSHGIHVLIDLNGHTLHSGLSIFAYRPAPVQMSFLGYPMTTGDPHIDFFVSDPVTTPPELCAELFVEKMLLLPTHYIVNDHMQMLGHTIRGARPTLADVPPLFGDHGHDQEPSPPFVFATFSNWQKMDPFVFRAWMAILARVPHSVLWFIRSKGHVEAEANLREEACGHGIDGHRRLVFSDYQPWLHHTHGKRAADLVLDTTLKNGHTTILDALFAGVPVVTLEGNRMSNRAASSALHALRLHELTVNSVKEYVDLAVQLATDRRLLARLRATTEQHRMSFPLFDTQRFTHQLGAALRSAWHVGKRAWQRNATAMTSGTTGLNVFSPVVEKTSLAPRFFAVHDALDDDETVDAYEERVKHALVHGEHILLHIGGEVARAEWWIVNIQDRADVDFVLPMDRLYPFPESSVAAIYASHVLEHVHFGVDNDVRHTLDEWHRVLRPGGALFVAVPDLAVLSSLFVNETLTEQDRFDVMRMIHGGQVDAFDVHKVGFNFAFLSSFLELSGFCQIQRINNFGLFPDASSAEFLGTPISLNVRARACKSGGEWIQTSFAWDADGSSTGGSSDR